MVGTLPTAQIHTRRDPWRLPKEIFSALVAGGLASPLVSIVDKSIVKDITGFVPFMAALKEAFTKMLHQPRAFFTGAPFLLTYAVYAGTYLAANLSELGLDYAKSIDPHERKTVKVAFSASANIGLLAWRDSVFARMYATSAQVTRTPRSVISLFAFRDAATMWATFYAAPQAAQYLQDKHHWNNHMAQISTALVVPAATQIVTAPIHILAIDLFNRPVARDRWAKIVSEYGKVCLARTMRILPAFGLGSFVNTQIREQFIRHGHWYEHSVAIDVAGKANENK